MKTISFNKFLTLLEREDLIYFIEAELSDPHLIKILLRQKKSYPEFMEMLSIESGWVNDEDINEVVKQALEGAPRKTLLTLIEKTTPEKSIIKILSGLSKERKDNIGKAWVESSKLISVAKNILNTGKIEKDEKTEQITKLFDLYELCYESYKSKSNDYKLIAYINQIGGRVIKLIDSKLFDLRAAKVIAKSKKSSSAIKKIDVELLGLNKMKKSIRFISQQDEMDFGFEMIDLKKLVSKSKNIFDTILELGKISHSTDEAIRSEPKSKALNNYKTKVNKLIESLVLEQIKTHLGDKFSIKINGKETKKLLPDNINLREVHGKSIAFDFYVRKGKQEVTFNGHVLHQANHFFIIWLGDLLGFEESERFRNIYSLNIESLNPFMDDLYIFDSSLWDGTELSGILSNEGDVLLPPKYSQIERIGISDYFQAYRLNINEGDEVKEGWEYYDKKGKPVTKEIIEKAEDESYEMELDRNYEAAKRLVWSQKELNEMKFIKQHKFSKAFDTIKEIKPLLEKKLNDYKSILRYPNLKFFIYKDLYVAYCDKNPKYKFVVGIDPDMNEHFDLHSE
ncbi:MAG: hypothetical protein JNK50_04440 [Bacteroidia bacterium]|nr:hypothetical protein [Bacteroidia bacterium]